MIGVVFGVSDHTELHMCVVTNSTKQMMMKYRIAHGRRRKKTPIRAIASRATWERRRCAEQTLEA
jgi:hypothetical protein